MPRRIGNIKFPRGLKEAFIIKINKRSQTNMTKRRNLFNF